MVKGASEDKLTHLLICWRWTPGSPETACRQRWMTGLAGERQPWGSTEVDLAVVVEVVIEVVRSVFLLARFSQSIFVSIRDRKKRMLWRIRALN